jgi:hypothetical protein
LTVKTNQDRDFLICRDKLLKPVKNFLTVETNFFFVLVESFKIKTYQSRLCLVKIFVKIVEIVETNQDLSRNLDTMETFWVWKYSLDKLRNLVKKYAKIHWLLDRDRDELSRNDKISRSWQISRSPSRLLGLGIDVKTNF